MAIGNTHHMQFQPAFLLQFFLLAMNLFNQAGTHCSRTTDKQIQYLIFRQEE